MSITEGLFADWLLWPALAGYTLLLLLALWRAPWARLGHEPRLQHLWLGAAVALLLMWLLRAGISAGLSIHFLGATTMALLFGWQLAILAMTLALIGTTAVGLEAWSAFGLNGLTTVALPVAFSLAFLRLMERWLPPNFFVYLFVGVFLNSALAIALSGSTAIGLLWLLGVYPLERLVSEYLILLPLIMFPEALMNGFVMTGMMVFYPDWIKTFDAGRYIDRQ